MGIKESVVELGIVIFFCLVGLECLPVYKRTLKLGLFFPHISLSFLEGTGNQFWVMLTVWVTVIFCITRAAWFSQELEKNLRDSKCQIRGETKVVKSLFCHCVFFYKEERISLSSIYWLLCSSFESFRQKAQYLLIKINY